jgi:hypothetical protein
MPLLGIFLLFLPATTQLPTQLPGMHSAQRGRMVQLSRLFLILNQMPECPSLLSKILDVSSHT